VRQLNSGMVHCIIAGGAGAIFYSNGRSQTNSGLCCCKKQETKTITGEWVCLKLFNSSKVSREDQDEFAYNSHMKA
jgi:hypothetical protein